jgi:hypothetical protein
MTPHRSRSTSVLIAALLLVGGLNVAAYATNGHPLLLGRTGQETSSTSVRNAGQGPALRLRSRAGAASLSVSSRAEVARLDADRVDGFHRSQLGTRVWTYLIGGDNDESDLVKSFPGLPRGVYLVSYVVHASYNAGLHCWLVTGQGAEMLSTQSTVDGRSISAEGYVDARHGVTMRLVSGGIFDTGDFTGTNVSQIVFIRLATSAMRTATILP